MCWSKEKKVVWNQLPNTDSIQRQAAIESFIGIQSCS
ncbi:unnamed protein product [Callosobruchus maculatus]|uniref:Uncharacterized protein n=1 Tax=Callosobruchus maculatus TaxID=64391 RepID=A0A653BFW4_CALMS|nr:unnamed protein product [Callosobruchus maculatus]